MPGEFQPHVRMMHTGFENVTKAADFGLPYIVIREPRPYDTTTLNYNWQIWETDAYSLYSNTTGQVLGQVIDPCTGRELEVLVSPVGGIVFFQHNEPLIYAHTAALKILED